MKLIFLLKIKVIFKILEYLYVLKCDDKEEDFLKIYVNKFLIKEDFMLEWFVIVNEDRCRVRVIEWVIYYGYYFILNYIVG